MRDNVDSHAATRRRRDARTSVALPKPAKRPHVPPTPRRGVAIWLLLLLLPAVATAQVTTASKSFTESVILGELLAATAEDVGVDAEHRAGLGGSGLVFQSLLDGNVDAYVEYTGTLTGELLAGENLADEDELRAYLAERGIVMTRPLGFNNTYAFGMLEARAAELGIETTSDLRDHPDLVVRMSSEFTERADGWPAVRDAYGLPQRDVGGMEHTLAYLAVSQGAADVTELYTTDAEIEKLDLRVLDDDRGFFPRYDAVILYRADLADRHPDVAAAWEALVGTIDEGAMASANARVVVDQASERQAAADLRATLAGGESVTLARRSVLADVWDRTLEHVRLVAVAMLLGVVTAVPLGILAAKSRSLGWLVLSAVGVVQTVPSLALLALLVTLLSRLGFWPAVIALWLYSLLPMVRNTHAGLTGLPPAAVESARALGLSGWDRLTRVELPMALPSVLAGVKVSAVLTVGFATLGAFIDAGGYGQPIIAGLRRLDTPLILQGAVPAAALALLTQAVLAGVERLAVPRGMRAAT